MRLEQSFVVIAVAQCRESLDWQSWRGAMSADYLLSIHDSSCGHRLVTDERSVGRLCFGQSRQQLRVPSSRGGVQSREARMNSWERRRHGRALYGNVFCGLYGTHRILLHLRLVALCPLVGVGLGVLPEEHSIRHVPLLSSEDPLPTDTLHDTGQSVVALANFFLTEAFGPIHENWLKNTGLGIYRHWRPLA